MYIASHATFGSHGATFDDFVITKVKNDGRIDTGFGGGPVKIDWGVKRDERPVDIDVRSTGRILVTGNQTKPPHTYGSDAASIVFAQLTPTGALDATFGTGGKQTLAMLSETQNTADETIVAPDGKIVVTGYITEAPVVGDLEPDFILARVNADGRALDATFASGGWLRYHHGATENTFTTGNAVVRRADGLLVAFGAHQSTEVWPPPPPYRDFFGIGVKNNGTIDYGFGPLP